MPATLVAADLDLAADVGLDLTAEVTLELVVRLDRVAELDELVVTEGVHPGVRVDTGGGEDLLGAGTADAVDVGERDLDALVAREVDSNKACHVLAGFPSVDRGGLVAMRPGLRWSGSRLRPSAPEVIGPSARLLERGVPSDRVA